MSDQSSAIQLFQFKSNTRIEQVGKTVNRTVSALQNKNKPQKTPNQNTMEELDLRDLMG